MSIDLNWEAATSGPDGEQLAERIRSFIHDKFQQVPLPRFIRSVNVHSFEFGSIAPELEIKDICDPFVDFYEESDSSEDDEDTEGHHDDTLSDTPSDRAAAAAADKGGMRYGHDNRGDGGRNPNHHDHLRTSQWVTGEIDGHHHSTQSPLRSPIGLGDHLNAQFRSSTPNILPGVTSNLGYHLMMGNLSGTQTPLGAAVAGGTPFGTGWPDAVMNHGTRTGEHAIGKTHAGNNNNNTNSHDTGSPSRPSTANTNPTQLSHGRSAADSSSNNTSNDPTVTYTNHASSTTTTTHGLHEGGDRPRDKQAPRIDEEELSTPHMRERRPEDFQVICRVKYAGDVKLSLTAEILLDYPMPSFVGLPLKLNITGITFDGVAVVAYIRRRTHLCFLSPEDADALLGDEEEQDIHHPYSTPKATVTSGDISTDNKNEISDHENHPPQPRRRFGSLLQQIRVDSEIGRKENGKQALKNVGKVERFVLDQVRRIFEDEFVFPSFWTFLV